MNYLIALSIAFCCCCLLVAAASSASTSNDDPISSLVTDSDWLNFKLEHGKSYESLSEDSMRRAIFAKNKLSINQFNANGMKKYRRKVNHFADWTESEIKQLLGYKAPLRDDANWMNSPKAQEFLDNLLREYSLKELPKAVDWRNVSGRVSPVKDQGKCGSCWAFSTTGVLEGQMVPRNLSLVELSEQNLVDCSNETFGCSGGWIKEALEFVHSEGGIESESSYPYEAVGHKCRFNNTKVAFTDYGAAILPPNDRDKLKQVVANFGPVSAVIDATEIFYYDGGIYEPDDCTQINHAVLIVGYGIDEDLGEEYWIVKNSWGEKWGKNGYLLVEMDNDCYLSSEATIPTF